MNITIDRNGTRFGPYDLEQINQLLRVGQFTPNNLAWVEGTQNWVPLRQIPGIIHIPTPPAIPGQSDKRILPVFLLAFFVGVLGIHRFYVGKTGTAVVMLVLTCTFFGMIVTAIWSMVDWIMAVCGAFTDKDGNKITQWT